MTRGQDGFAMVFEESAESIAFSADAGRLRDLRADLIAHTTSDGLFNRWLGEMAEAMRDQFRFVQRRYERLADDRRAA